MKKTCAYCEKEFTTLIMGLSRKYCSDSCRRKRWQQGNKDYGKKKMREWRKEHPNYLGPKRQEIADKVTKIKESTPCRDCGKYYPACCMEFDHIGNNKSGEVGSLVAMTKSWDVIQSEINKCDLVCANCHKIRTKNKGSNGWTRKTIEKDEYHKGESGV